MVFALPQASYGNAFPTSKAVQAKLVAVCCVGLRATATFFGADSSQHIARLVVLCHRPS